MSGMTEAEFPDSATVKAVIDQLTPMEHADGVVYIFGSILHQGTRLDFPHILIEIPWPQAALAFVDREPLANWSHSSRYILINLETDAVRSYEAKLPPFQPTQSSRWRLLYKADAVPDEVLMIKPK
jgi:hypothetical protein